MRFARKTPPPAANNPRFTSGTPNFASRLATTMSDAIINSNPPATAVPFTAQITGTSTPLRIQLMKCLNPASKSAPTVFVPSAKPLRSIPAQNARSPVAVMITARISELFSASLRPLPSPPITAGFIAFRASGLLIRSVRMCPLSSLIRSI